MHVERFHRFRQGTILALGTLLLVLSWLVLFWWLDEFAILSLVPYDDVMPEARPSPDTWQRQLNDTFEIPPWRHVPAWLLVSVSIALFIIALGRTSKWPAVGVRLELYFALSNFLFVAVSFLSGFALVFLPNLPVLKAGEYYPPGYEWTYRFILADTVFLILWLVLQAWGISKWLLSRFPHEAANRCLDV